MSYLIIFFLYLVTQVILQTMATATPLMKYLEVILNSVARPQIELFRPEPILASLDQLLFTAALPN